MIKVFRGKFREFIVGIRLGHDISVIDGIDLNLTMSLENVT
jgi:hypothetical protein